jgi:hypothetical protein
MDNVLILGNKPYIKLKMSGLIDGFDNIFRCNFALPNNNNGSKYGTLYMCNHLYDNVISKKVSIATFKSIYKTEYKDAEIDYFFDKFNKDNYDSIIHAVHNKAYSNSVLADVGCPHRFSKIPRTGYTIVLNEVARKSRNIFVSNFSMTDEKRETYYIVDSYNESVCHNKDEELKIINWLHKNNVVDATMCLLEDTNLPTLQDIGLEPSKFIVDKLKDKYGKVTYKGNEL